MITLFPCTCIEYKTIGKPTMHYHIWQSNPYRLHDSPLWCWEAAGNGGFELTRPLAEQAAREWLRDGQVKRKQV